MWSEREREKEKQQLYIVDRHDSLDIDHETFNEQSAIIISTAILSHTQQ